jgi:hypothetical protein
MVEAIGAAWRERSSNTEQGFAPFGKVVEGMSVIVKLILP